MARNRKGIYLLALLPFIVVVFVFEVVPLMTIVINSFMPKDAIGFTLEHYKSIFSQLMFTQAIKNSIKISLISSFFGILIAFLSGMSANNLQVRSKLHKTFLTVLNMLSNFAGVPLAFAYMIILGNSGILVQIGKEYGFSFLADYNLYTSAGLNLIYVYFQIPLGTLLLYPAFKGVRNEWKEASGLMGASSIYFWRKVGVPVLLPSILGTVSVLFANALAAYATAYALLMNNYSLLPISISGMFIGDVVQQKELGGALSMVMMALMLIAISVNNFIIERNKKWGGVSK